MSEIRATASQQRSERQAADLQSQAADLQSQAADLQSTAAELQATAIVTRELQRQITAQEVTLRSQEVALDQVTRGGEERGGGGGGGDRQEVALDQVTQRGEGVAVVVVVVGTSRGGFFDCHCN